MLGSHSMPRSAGYGKGSARRSSHQSKRGVQAVQPRSRCSRLVVMAEAQASTVLVGDIGGTNARLSLWTADSSYSTSSELFAKTYPTADHLTFEHVMGVFLKEAKDKGAAPSSAALAIAGAVVDNRCAMTNVQWIVDGAALEKQYGIQVQLLNDFEAVGYGIPVLEEDDVVFLNRGMAQPKAPKIVMGPGTGLGAAQLFWDDALEDYRVWPGEGSHASFAPRGWKQYALGLYAAGKLGGHVEVEQVACGSGLELIYEFLLTDEPANRQDVNLGLQHAKTAAEISKAALSNPCEDILACEAVDILMAIVGAEAGAMALRCIARGGVYIAGGITPRLLTRLQNTPSGGGSLLEGFLCRDVRDKFKDILQTIPLAVITNGKVGQIGARQVACTILKRGRRDH